MPCLGPLSGYRPKQKGRNGEPFPYGKRLVFRKDRSETGVVVKVPCGQCIECRLDYARQWAVRCMHESMEYQHNTFLTLTYADEKLPANLSLDKAELSAAMKRLHNRLLRSREHGIRYYACGEYGEQYARPHYHALVFDYGFPDRKYWARKDEVVYYTSDELSEVWPHGHAVIGDVTYDSAMYVAGYVAKKVRGAAAAAHYGVREPEFSVMSKGIGKRYVEKYGSQLLALDRVVMNGGELRPPRYYDVFSKLADPVEFEAVKRRRDRKRRRMAKLTSRRSFAREKIVNAKLTLRAKEL